MIHDEVLSNNEISFRNMALSYPYLYMNRSDFLAVYDLSVSYDKIQTIGNSIYNAIYFFTNEDLYILKNNHFSNSSQTEIISALSNEVIFSKEFEPQFLNLCEIKGSRLFARANKNIDGTLCNYLDIYQLNTPDYPLISSNLIEYRMGNIAVSESFIYIENRDTNQVDIYIYDDNLVYNSSINGLLPTFPIRYDDKLYILSYNTISIRDIHDPQSIIYSHPSPYDIKWFYPHDENSLFVTDRYDRSMIYRYNLLEQEYMVIGNILGASNSFNGVISENAYDTNTSIYYEIIDNNLVQIGSKIDDIRYVNRTYFFPTESKMVQFNNNGFFVFNVEITVSESDI
ncbi:MAG: hypothetical protein FWG20_06020 [Candidatus Cloacimonetes bacterium]|nr:hypothetical protein [Candidatus Cloacimonadota bacterium]